jgi:hypothetical protein
MGRKEGHHRLLQATNQVVTEITALKDNDVILQHILVSF